jgi:hypothetical protein
MGYHSFKHTIPYLISFPLYDACQREAALVKAGGGSYFFDSIGA